MAWGYIDTAYLDSRPWTRLSCVRMLERAEELFQAESANPQARSTYDALRKEFQGDYIAATRDRPAPHAELDSIYERSLGIAGPPINDSFHFGQTLINDYGRPFQEGLNQTTGLSLRAEYGPFSFSLRAEYEYAPARAAYSDSVRQAIAGMDDNPVLPAQPVARTSSFNLLDANISANLAGNEISLGKSEMWWGPAEGGAFSFTNNSDPIYMLRINRIEPLIIPSRCMLFGRSFHSILL